MYTCVAVTGRKRIFLIQLALLVLCFEHTAQELVYLHHIHRSYYKPTLSILGGSMTQLQTHEHQKSGQKLIGIMSDFYL